MLLAKSQDLKKRPRRCFISTHYIFCTEPPRYSLSPWLLYARWQLTPTHCGVHINPVQHSHCLAYHHFYSTPQRLGLSIIIKEGSDCKSCPPVNVICVYVCVWFCLCACGWLYVISVKEIKVTENSRIRMWCDVPFPLPNDIEMIWRFAEEVGSVWWII